MPFPKKNLNANETIALDMHPHWWYFAEPAWSLLGSIVLGIIVLSVLPPLWSFVKSKMGPQPAAAPRQGPSLR